MNKLTGMLLILAAIFTGCQKSTPVSLAEQNAHVLDGGNPAADGAGFYIRVDSGQKEIFPINLPAEYQLKDINIPVAVKYVPAGKNFQGRDQVYIVTIRKL